LLEVKRLCNVPVQALECYPLCLFPDLDKYARFAVRNCRAGITACAISSTGDMRPCAHADMVYGNILTEELKSVWLKMADWRSGQYLPDECQKCTMSKECSGGCRMEAKYHGDICGVDPSMTKPFETKPPMIPLGVEVGADSHYELNDNITYRPEDFGYIVTREMSQSVFFINSDGLNLLSLLAAKGSFVPAEIANSKGVEVTKVTDFIARLIKNDLCKEVISNG